MQLNLLPSGVMPVLYLNQYDYGTLKTFEVYNGAELFAIPTGYSVTLRATKPDGYGITVAGSYAAGQHIVFVTIPQQLTAAAGDVIAELVFTNANSVRVGTINFVIRIEPAALSDNTVISDSDIAYAEEVLDQLQSVQALGNQVSQNTAAISTEASTRAAAVASLQAADTALGNSLSAETSARQASDTALADQIAALQGAVGSPLVAATKSAMTETDRIYVYTGSESGMTSGNWYYYDGSAWVSGGVYNAVAVNTDTTLSVAGMAADAKATGDQVTDLKSQLDTALSGSQVYCDTIPEGADLDAYVTPGNYKALSGTVAESLHNSPGTVAFRLFVMVTTVGGRVLQMAFPNASGQSSKLAVRFYNGSSWTDWNHLTSYEMVSDMLLNSFIMTATDAVAIASGTDLDTLKTPGNFKCTSTSTAGSLVNCPVSAAFALKVVALSQNARLMQALYAQTSTMGVYRRYWSGSTWSAWLRDAKQEEIINLSNVILTESNYLTYFPNGLFSDAQPNTIYGILDSTLFADAPEGDAWIGMPGRTRGSMRGTLFTFSQANRHDLVQTGISQIFVGYRNTSYKPTISYRIAIVVSGAYVWSDWSKFEENGYLRASNLVVYGGNMDVSFTDMDDMPANTIVQIDLNVDGHDPAYTLAHHPAPGVSCVAMCYAFSYTTDHGKVQTVYTIDGRLYWRYGYQQSAQEYRWTAWRQCVSDSGDYLRNKGRLPNGSDLNSIFENAIYQLGGTSAGYVNAPSTSAGFLTSKQTGEICLQTVETLGVSTYRRYTLDGGTTWSAWA